MGDSLIPTMLHAAHEFGTAEEDASKIMHRCSWEKFMNNTFKIRSHSAFKVWLYCHSFTTKGNLFNDPH
ncbi:hypothetical protein IHE45_08G000100 [Dioscorea alata]|uniref:Uncharacterized protein n=1 Tax=Dioscorea alata TaxID=55571 RepID=A0ACB7VGQ6_DIOAL|nr:hypothetical protein IHE45_08G000100 [Dioscorea alata]